jgi:hypothetical protein
MSIDPGLSRNRGRGVPPRRHALGWSLVAVLCGSGCASPGPDEAGAAPASLRALEGANERVLDTRGDQRIVERIEPLNVPVATDVIPPRALAWLEGDMRRPPPRPSHTGKLTAFGPVWVTTDERLIDARGGMLARGVVPELSVSPDGRRVAYAAHEDDGSLAVFIMNLEDGTAERLPTGLAHAGSPLFVDAATIVVVGARAGGIAGVWRVRLDAGASGAQPLTNATLRVGAPPGASFVPPPARHASMRVEGRDLVYDDGRGERRVPLAPEGRP